MITLNCFQLSAEDAFSVYEELLSVPQEYLTDNLTKLRNNLREFIVSKLAQIRQQQRYELYAHAGSHSWTFQSVEWQTTGSVVL